MKEYIERNDLIRELEYDLANDINMYNSHIDKEIRDDKICFACDVLASAPAADVREVVHAKWERVSDWDSDNNACFNCSNCHHGDIHAKGQEVPYCWYCGAKMDSKHIKEKFKR